MKTSAPDPITLEILYNALKSIGDETFIALMRSAYSTNIKERRDHSTAIMDTAGRLVVQAESSLPVHIASMTGLMAKLLEKFGGDIHDGDIFIANDPHVAGGTHLPDINMAMPVFHDGALLAFMCNIAHHADVGGMAPGSMAGGMSEIYQEGLRIPVVRLFRKGVISQDIFDLILLNVRIPEERRGDYYAQIAACKLGARRLLETAGVYGNRPPAGGLRRDHRPDRTAHAPGHLIHSRRHLRLRRRDGRRRPRRRGHPHSPPHRHRRRAHPLRLHRNGGAGQRQHQRHRQRHPLGRCATP